MIKTLTEYFSLPINIYLKWPYLSSTCNPKYHLQLQVTRAQYLKHYHVKLSRLTDKVFL